MTGPDYGRIWDHKLVSAVIDIAGNGTGDTRWKVPGVLDWNTMTHNPFVDITKDTTTLYPSDPDVFCFWWMIPIPSRPDVYRMDRRICTIAVFIAGTAKSGRRRLALLRFICGPSA